jgi:hypothetical protein
VSWPTSRTTQTFRDLAADQMIEITEGADSYRVVPQRPLAIPTRWAGPDRRPFRRGVSGSVKEWIEDSEFKIHKAPVGKG